MYCGEANIVIKNNSISTKVKAHAKINLFLEATSRRSDGYHGISTVMLSLSLCDDVTVGLRENRGDIAIACDRADIPCDCSNTAYRAVLEFARESGLDVGADVVIKKRIPSAAGLGGGSADAAAVLTAMNRLTGNPLDKQRMIAAAARVGADVPFCLVGGCVLAGGLGDDIIRAFPVPDCTVLIAKPAEGVSTPAAYRELDRIFAGFNSYMPRTPDELLAALEMRDAEALGDALYNIFEKAMPALCPPAVRISERLASLSLGSLLSGSGSSVFALFRDEQSARSAADAIEQDYPGTDVILCVPTQCGLSLYD